MRGAEPGYVGNVQPGIIAVGFDRQAGRALVIHHHGNLDSRTIPRLGPLGVGDVGLFKEAYEPLLMEPLVAVLLVLI